HQRHGRRHVHAVGPGGEVPKRPGRAGGRAARRNQQSDLVTPRTAGARCMRRTGGWTTVALFFLGLTPVSPFAHERDDRMALGVPTLKSVEDLILAARKTAMAL